MLKSFHCLEILEQSLTSPLCELWLAALILGAESVTKNGKLTNCHRQTA
jgi:hypothetical protein